MHIRDLNGKRILILGYGREGRAMLKALERNAPEATVTVADQNPVDIPHSIFDIRSVTGPEYLSQLAQHDVIIRSPGIPPSSTLNAQRSTLTSSTQIFLDSIADTGAQVIGVTGTKGKSTTTSLIYTILNAGGKDAVLVGNIGEPAIAHVHEAKPGTIFVLEMSSAQLMDLTVSPHIAVVINLYPEHLDYHGSFAAYREAKRNICRFQKPQDAVFYSADTTGAWEVAEAGDGKKIPYAAEDAPIRIEETHLIGRHNLSNIAGASAVAAYLNIDRSAVRQAIQDFRGLPHRLQLLGTHHGIEWVDDAISTTPQSTIAALDALGPKVQTLILGGKDRGLTFHDLGERIAGSQVTQVILFPGSGPRIRQAIEDAHASGVEFHEASDMAQAVSIAKRVTQPGRICLLSTASPSYGMFRDFEEKGEAFAREVTGSGS